MAGSLAAILLVTLYPYTFSFQDFDRIYDLPRHFEGLEHIGLLGPLLNPDPDAPLSDILEPLANILLFLPLGFGLTYVINKRTHSWIAVFFTVQALGTGLSLFVESAQVFIPARHSTIVDLWTNSVGSLLGFIGFWLWKERNTFYIVWTSPRTWTISLATYVALVTAPSLYVAYAPHLWTPSNWASTFPLLMGNEATGDRPWKGHTSQLFISDQALSKSDVAATFSADQASGLPNDKLLALYVLGESNTYPDQTGLLPSLSWMPAPPKDFPKGGVALNRRHWLVTDTAAAHMAERVRTSSALTLGVTFTPANTRQRGPARIVSNSGGPSERNFTLGQHNTNLVLRLRTPFTGANGNAVSFVVPNVLTDASHRVVVTYDRSALRVYVNNVQNVYTVELTPSAKVVWFVTYLATGRLEVELQQTAPPTYPLLYYGLVYVLPSVFLAVIACTFYVRRFAAPS